jgi:Big-like domain-containing protein
LWYNLVSAHSNIFMALSGHVRNPSPGDYPGVPEYNGVGYVDCNVQSWTTLCSSPNRPIQILSDFQGQGNGGYFGYGYLRVLTVSPARKTVSVSTYSPSIATRPQKFPAGIPAQKTDAYDQYTLNFPPSQGGPDTEITQIRGPRDGDHVSSTFTINAAASGPDTASGMEIYVDGTNYAKYQDVAALPTGTTVTLSTTGTHRVTVQSYDTKTSTWVKSVVYVTNP